MSVKAAQRVNIVGGVLPILPCFCALIVEGRVSEGPESMGVQPC